MFVPSAYQTRNPVMKPQVNTKSRPFRLITCKQFPRWNHCHVLVEDKREWTLKILLHVIGSLMRQHHIHLRWRPRASFQTPTTYESADLVARHADVILPTLMQKLAFSRNLSQYHDKIYYCNHQRCPVLCRRTIQQTLQDAVIEAFQCSSTTHFPIQLNHRY